MKGFVAVGLRRPAAVGCRRVDIRPPLPIWKHRPGAGARAAIGRLRCERRLCRASG